MNGVEQADTGHLSPEVLALVHDLRAIGEEAPNSGAKDRAGNPYRPMYYMRAVERAVTLNRVVERVQEWVHEKPTTGFNSLVEADRPDLTVEAVVLRESTAYAHLFSAADRNAAYARLRPFRDRAALSEKAELERRARIEAIKASGQRMDLSELRRGRRTGSG